MPARRASSVPGLRAAVAAGPPVATMAAPPAAAESHAAGTPSYLPPERPEPPAQPRAAALPPRPVKPVRFTLDLTPELHHFLKRFALDTGTDAAVVMRALLARLRDDPELAQRVQADIWTSR